MATVVLGIHSNITGSDNSSGASSNSQAGGSSAARGTQGSSAKTGGHAWISITKNAKTTCYGLWPDNHPRTIDNGADSDIRQGLETLSGARASRYYELTLAQASALETELKSNVEWGYTNNCSSWASAVIYRVVGEDVDADDWGLLGAETPRKLGESIRRLEVKRPTSRLKPVPVSAGGGGGSSW